MLVTAADVHFSVGYVQWALPTSTYRFTVSVEGATSRMSIGPRLKICKRAVTVLHNNGTQGWVRPVRSVT